MASTIETTCPKCGGFAEFYSDDGSTHCQKEVTEVLYPGAKFFTKRGGGCGQVTRSENYEPPMYRGG